MDCFWGRVNPRLDDFCKPTDTSKGESKGSRSVNTFMLTYDKQNIIFKERDFDIAENLKEAFLCMSKLSPFAKLDQDILLPLFCTLSIISLTAVVIVHALFKELQNLYGFCLVGLSITLMIRLALLLLLYISNSRESFFVVQVVGHYLWLCVYSWEVVLTYQVHRTFTVDFVANRMNMMSTKRRAKYYALFAMGSPFPFVISGLIVHFTFDFSYYKYVFERNDLAMLFNFYLPLICLTLAGLGLLLNCLSNIRQARKKSAIRKGRMDFFFIALRVS
ncbi:hypothetical protein HOLleu_42035 [Holothuria leucospilota]|uniref:G-protein coupled receptors family 2 profile 2 domain-containing protein n=1 Tax=Holothuria leucospilota TaxID=206669 RepID=A0A9Q1BCD2_HOLLE|nr:hypothetical protein HOLleu_42035 [Holothuria leucospilota]